MWLQLHEASCNALSAASPKVSMHAEGTAACARHPAGGVAGQVAKLPSLMALHHGEVIHQ